jgi:cytochrome c biogenesis protein CcdA
MLRDLVLVVSIALADALNPGTLVPALYFATTDNARSRVAAFGAAFFAVNMLGGAFLVLGPGELVLAAVSTPSNNVEFAVEIVAGIALLVVGLVFLLRGPREAIEPEAESELKQAEGRGAGAVGASLAALELPTAFPYFAAIAAIVGSGVGEVSQLLLVGVFNVVFLSPILAIFIALSVAGPSIEPKLRRIGDRLRAGWRRVAVWLALVAGTVLIGFGVAGFAGLR